MKPAAGQKGGELLPTLLKPGQLVNEEQRQRFREQAGIGGFGDIARLIEVSVKLLLRFEKIC